MIAMTVILIGIGLVILSIDPVWFGIYCIMSTFWLSQNKKVVSDEY